MPPSFYSHNFGCRVNQAEKEELDRQLINLGYTYTNSEPDVFIINSCSVTHKAEREAKQLVYQLKRDNPNLKVVVTGCAATNWIKTKQSIPEIDLLIDNANKEYLASIIHKNMHREAEITVNQTPVIHDKFLKSGRVIIKIQDGCQRFCTYCIVPYLRGLPKSTSIATIIEKINSLNGIAKEIILTAINTEAFGYDSKESFINLVSDVLDRTTVERISFGSVHPWSVNQQFFDLYKNHLQANRIVNFFHIPLQSGSNKILTIMKRGYTREEFVEKLKTLAEIKPFTFIGTDIIVGYLEETDKDFEDTYSFLKQSPISKFHVFRFSKRQHTAAFYMAKRLKEPDAATKQKRAQALIELGKRKYETFLQSHLDQNFSALFLEKKKDKYQHVLLSNQVPALIETAEDLTSTIRNVKILQYKNGTLFGKIV